MTPIRDEIIKEAIVEVVDPECVTSERSLFHSIDINVVSDHELDFTAPFSLSPPQKEGRQIDGFVLTWDVGFWSDENGDVGGGDGDGGKCELSTAVECPPTHWKQTLLLLSTPIPTPPTTTNTTNEVNGTITIRRMASNPRDIEIEISYQMNGGKKMEQCWILAS